MKQADILGKKGKGLQDKNIFAAYRINDFFPANSGSHSYMPQRRCEVKMLKP
jgi:hypothetical protein